jgi:AraC-like DNA-binding protein
MKEPKVTVKIVKENEGYSATAKVQNHFIATQAENYGELKEMVIEALNLAFEDKGIVYSIEEIQSEFDLESFFDFYRVINVKALSERIGMNQSLLAQYINPENSMNFLRIFNIITDAQLNGRSIMFLDSVEMVNVQGFASESVPASQYAQTVIRLKNGTDFIKDLETWPSGKKGSQVNYNPSTFVALLGLAQPNPASGSIRLFYQLPDKLNEDYFIQINNTARKTLMNIKLDNQDKYVELNLSSWLRELYHYVFCINAIIPKL